MYGLVQEGTIAHTAFNKHLRTFGYDPAPITPELWLQNKNGITFTLVVGDFGIRYERREDAIHLINAPQERYKITQDCTKSLYSGITLNWEYKAIILDRYMPGYVK